MSPQFDSSRDPTSRYLQVHPTELESKQLLAQCQVQRIARGGPGGQHRNKTASAVILKHMPSGIVAEANERRDQSVNLQRAIFRLRVQLALEVRVQRESWPSPLWKSRCPRGRIALDPLHADFPRMLAEALDVLEQFAGDIHQAAEDLACSTSQLVRLLSMDARGLALLNADRQARGLKSLRPRD